MSLPMMMIMMMRMISIEVFQDHFCTTGDWTRINDSKKLFHILGLLFYEPDDIGNMTKKMILTILILIMMVIMFMLIFLQAKVFQVALKVGLALLDLTHFTQI